MNSIANTSAMSGYQREVRDGESKRPNTKPLIVTNRRDLRDISEDAIDALIVANDPPRILNRGGALVSITTRASGLQIEPLGIDSLRNELSRIADWRTRTESDGYIPVFPNGTVVRDVLAQPYWPFPNLERVVSAPVFTRSGRLITQPGYDEESGIYLDPKGLMLSEIPADPNSVEEAKRLILGELLHDFPFISEAEKAHAVGLLLVPFVRDLIEGSVPIHVAESSTPGTGKGLLVNVCTIPAVGRHLPSMTEGRDEDENRKRITAHLMKSPEFVYLDNVRRPVDSSSLASAITAEVWEDRLLGQTKMVRIPMRAVFVITGNNPSLSNEIARRAIRIRLDAGIDQPWRRGAFRHSLPRWAMQNRTGLVRSALVLVNAWLSAGRPEWKGSPLGSFEEWSSTMGGIFDVVGIPGFLSNLDEFYAGSDRETRMWSALIEAWWSKYGDRSVGVGDLFQLATVALDLGTGDERALRTRFGRQLGQRRDQIIGGCRIENAGTYQGGARHRLVKAGTS